MEKRTLVIEQGHGGVLITRTDEKQKGRDTHSFACQDPGATLKAVAELLGIRADIWVEGTSICAYPENATEDPRSWNREKWEDPRFPSEEYPVLFGLDRDVVGYVKVPDGIKSREVFLRALPDLVLVPELMEYDLNEGPEGKEAKVVSFRTYPASSVQLEGEDFFDNLVKLRTGVSGCTIIDDVGES